MGRVHHSSSHELTDGKKWAIDAHLLGPARIYVNDRPLQDSAWQRRASRSLFLLLLATPGHALPRDRILDELWPGAAPAAALNALYVTIHGLRRALEPSLRSGRESSFVEVVGDIVRLPPDCSLWVDVDAFEKTLAQAAGEPPRERLITLRQALALYADDLLADEPYSDWPTLRREQLRSAWRNALFEVADLEIESGNPVAATTLLPQVLTRDPADEAAHYRLMRALASAGRINDALTQYERCVALLREEVGSQPSAETSRLAAEIRSMEPDHSLLETTEDPDRHFVNVPAAPNPLIGRTRELETLDDLLLDPQIRLVTLTGPAGIGKTRLALELATRMVEEFANGVVFVPLASLTDPELVAPTLLRLLDPNADSASPSLESLFELLRRYELLLVLDNFEQIMGAAPHVAGMLEQAPGLNVLMTSREPLRLRAEHVVAVPPLSVPPAPVGHREAQLNLAALSKYEAVDLFTQRVRAIRPDFRMTEAEAVDIVDLCRHLDGLPLAIELAAAAGREHSPAEIRQALGDRLSLLGNGYRDLPPRQQTMRRAIAWSHDLLSPQQQRVFRRLSVFAGGCDLEAAQAVCTSSLLPRAGVTGELESLTEKNLLVSQESDFGTRHSMLETIREFGLEVLNGSGEQGEVRALHAGQFMALAERASPELTGPEQAAWFDRLEMEHDNVRAALNWAIDAGEIEVALRLSSAMTRFWLSRGHFQEGRRWLGRALAAERGPLALQAAALSAAGSLAEHQNEVGPAEALHRQALAIWRRLGDRRQIAASCASLGNVAQDSGEYAKAIELHQEALTLYRLEGDEWGTVRAFNNLGAVAYYQGAYERAQEYWTEALSAIRTIGDTRSECQLLNNLGALAYQRGDLPEARGVHEQALALRRRLGDKQGIASSLINLSEVARQENGPAQTEPMLQEAVLLAREIGDKPLTAIALAHLAMATRERGALDRAFELALESTQLLRETHDQRGLAGALLVMASVLVDQQQPRRAARLFVAADTLRDSIGAAWEPVEQMTLDRGFDQVRAMVGDDEFAAIRDEARTATFEHVLADPSSLTPAG